MPPKTDPGADDARAFIRKGSAFMVLDNVSKGLEPVLALLCAKLYVGGEWGTFKYFESLVLLLTRLCSLGLDSGVIWIRSRCADDREYVAKFSRTFNFVALASMILLALAFLQSRGCLPSFGRLAKGMSLPPPGEMLVFLACIPLLALTTLLTQSFVTRRELGYGLVIRNFAVPAAIYGPAVALAFTPLRDRSLAACYLAGNLVGFALAGWGFARLYRDALGAWSASAAIPRDMLRFSLPISTTGLVMSLAVRMDILLLARFVGASGIEIYSVVVMISNTLRSLRQSMDNVMLSVFSGKSAGPLDESRREHFNYATWLVMTLQIPFLFLAACFGRELLALLGPLYAEGYWVLLTAMAFNLLVTLGAFSLQMVLGIGKTFLVPVSQGVFFAFSVGLNLLLIPRIGALGAAVAMGTANALGVLVCFAGARRYAGSWFFRAGHLSAIALEAACFLPAVLPLFLREPPLIARAGAFALSLALFAAFSRRNWKKWSPFAPVARR